MPIINEFMTDDNFIIMKDGEEFVPVKCNNGVYILLQIPENMNDEEELDTELWLITSDDLCIVSDSDLGELDKRKITDKDKWFTKDDGGLDIKVYEIGSPIRDCLERWVAGITVDDDYDETKNDYRDLGDIKQCEVRTTIRRVLKYILIGSECCDDSELVGVHQFMKMLYEELKCSNIVHLETYLDTLKKYVAVSDEICVYGDRTFIPVLIARVCVYYYHTSYTILKIN